MSFSSVDTQSVPPSTENLDPVPFWRSTVILVLALLVGFSYWFNPPITIQPQAGVVMDLPILVGDYFGKKGEITSVEQAILPKDTEIVRRFYDDSHEHQINCSIVLSGAEQRSIHRPEACLVGQGWTIVDQEDVPIQLASGHKLVARNLSLERQEIGQNNEHFTVRAYYLYWFVGQNVTTPSHFKRILLSNWDRVIHNRGHRWAYVSMFSVITQNLRPDGLNPQQTKTALTDFVKQIVPAFQISEMPQPATVTTR
jgi:hypothetical protein